MDTLTDTLTDPYLYTLTDTLKDTLMDTLTDTLTDTLQTDPLKNPYLRVSSGITEPLLLGIIDPLLLGITESLLGIKDVDPIVVANLTSPSMFCLQQSCGTGIGREAEVI